MEGDRDPSCFVHGRLRHVASGEKTRGRNAPVGRGQAHGDRDDPAGESDSLPISGSPSTAPSVVCHSGTALSTRGRMSRSMMPLSGCSPAEIARTRSARACSAPVSGGRSPAPGSSRAGERSHRDYDGRLAAGDGGQRRLPCRARRDRPLRGAPVRPLRREARLVGAPLEPASRCAPGAMARDPRAELLDKRQPPT